MKVSVVLPVRNESAAVPALLTHLRRSVPDDRLELIVVDGGSTDGTAGTAGPLADRVIETRPGRAHQMHAGAAAATGDLLLFLHADTRLPQGWYDTLKNAWGHRPAPACTAFQLTFDNPRRVYRWIEAATRWRFYWTRVPHGDQALAVARRVYLEAGGFPDVPLMEEYVFAERLKDRGPVVLLPVSVTTSARRYEKNGPVWNAVRNVILVLLYRMGVSPARLARWYR